MACQLCLQLQTERDETDRVYTEAMAAFLHRINAAGADEYNRLRSAVNEARIDAELARVILEKHRVSHLRGS